MHFYFDTLKCTTNIIILPISEISIKLFKEFSCWVIKISSFVKPLGIPAHMLLPMLPIKKINEIWAVFCCLKAKEVMWFICSWLGKVAKLAGISLLLINCTQIEKEISTFS